MKYKMLNILPREIINTLFELLPITDKRNFTRCNTELYTKNKLIDIYQNDLLLLTKQKYKYIPKKLTQQEKYTIELIHDNYKHLFPIKYICNKNRLCSESAPFIYFYCAVNKNIKILELLLKFNKKLGRYITYGAAFSGHLDVLKWARENGCRKKHLVPAYPKGAVCPPLGNRPKGQVENVTVYDCNIF